MIIDTHCHLSKDDYSDIDQIVNNMKDDIMIISGVNARTNEEVMKYILKYPNVYGVVGIHPSEVDEITFDSYNKIDSYLKNPKIVGVGEIGLDYHYDNINKEKQQQAFIEQIKIAISNNKPIIIHSRDSYQDTYNILNQYTTLNTRIVMHCYSYSKECAYELKKLGCKFGIGGVITFRNAKKLVEVVEHLDITDILLETDSPYLAPEPHRGEKNEPRNVKHVANKIAEIKNMSLENVSKITTQTAINEFDLNHIL